MVFQKNTTYNKQHLFENKIVNSQEHIWYEVVSVNSVQQPSEMYNILICPMFFAMKKGDHDVKLYWRR